MELNRLSKANITAMRFDVLSMTLSSSSTLIPFLTMCVQVIKYNYEKKCTSVPQSKKLKGQYLSVSGRSQETMRDFNVHSSGMPVSSYGLEYGNFFNEITVISATIHEMAEKNDRQRTNWLLIIEKYWLLIMKPTWMTQWEWYAANEYSNKKKKVLVISRLSPVDFSPFSISDNELC